MHRGDEVPALREIWATKLSLLLVGGWVLVTLSVMYVAASSFRVVDLDNLRNATEVFAEIPEGEPRQQALRYVASEFNRHVFATYGGVNLVFSLAVLALLVISAQRNKWSLAAAAACVLISASFLLHADPDRSRAHDRLHAAESSAARSLVVLHAARRKRGARDREAGADRCCCRGVAKGRRSRRRPEPVTFSSARLPAAPYSSIGVGGPSALNMSAVAFQVPSDCFFQTVMYLPTMRVGLPSGSSIVIS